MERERVHLPRAEAVTQDLIQEEVVKLIRADEVFGLLADLAVAGRRQQLRAHRGIEDVVQAAGEVRVLGCIGDELDEVAHQRLRDACIDPVHGHMVGVVGRPAECELTEVAGADDDAVRLIRDVHEDLRPLTGLRVLVDHGMVLRVVPDVLEMLQHRGLDIDLAQRRMQESRQRHRIVVGAVRGAEGRHGHRDDVLAREAQHVEGARDDKQREGRVEAAGDADHGRLTAGVLESLLQSECLDREDLIAAGIALRSATRYERLRVDIAPEVGCVRRELSGQCLRRHAGGRAERCLLAEAGLKDLLKGLLARLRIRGRNLLRFSARRLYRRREAELHDAVRVTERIIDVREGRHAGALLRDALEVDIRDVETGIEAFSFRYDGAVLRDDILATEDQVRGRLPVAGIGITVDGYKPRTGRADQLPAVVVLADRLIGGRGVRDHRRTGQHMAGRWRIQHPDVLTDFTCEAEIRTVQRFHEDVHAEWNRVLLARHRRAMRQRHDTRLPRRKPATLIKLAVVRQVLLRNQCEDAAGVQHRHTVIQLVVNHIRHTDHRHELRTTRRLRHLIERRRSPLDQNRLVKQIRTGIRRQHQLRKHQQRNTLTICLPDLAKHRIGIKTHISNFDFRRGHRHPQESFDHNTLFRYKAKRSGHKSLTFRIICRPKVRPWKPDFSPSGAEHSSAGYRSRVCLMQTLTLLIVILYRVVRCFLRDMNIMRM